jgi:hypothetical protein
MKSRNRRNSKPTPKKTAKRPAVDPLDEKRDALSRMIDEAEETCLFLYNAEASERLSSIDSWIAKAKKQAAKTLKVIP